MTLEPIDDFEKEVLNKHKDMFKIIKLQAENFKKLKAIEITPQGNTIKISGPNAAGKSSVLDAIWFALAGKDALKMNPDPVKHGERVAKVTLDLGSEDSDNFVKNAYTVVRTWSNGNSKLEITNNEGMKYGSPAGMLSSIVGDLSFDPLAFAGQSDKEQVKTLLELVNLPIDIYALDDDRKVIYESRTLVNRAVKHLDGKVAGFPTVDAPDEEVNTSDIMTAMQDATTQISQYKDMRDNYVHKSNTKDELRASIKLLETQLLEKQDALLDMELEIDQLTPQIETLIDPDLSVFKDQLQNAEQINANVRSMQQRNQIIAELDAEKKNSEELTAKINEIDDLKERTIREAEMPIEGLGFNDLGVTFNNTLIKQCSTAEQHRISIAIGMAMNPKLRVILIDDGSALDSTTMKDIEDLAADKGYQLWVGVVDETGKIGICIEDGMILHDNYKNPQ
jgi:recombinational DNA repair ATPase RecF